MRRRWDRTCLVPLLVGLFVAHSGCSGKNDGAPRIAPPDEPGSLLAGTLVEAFTYSPEVVGRNGDGCGGASAP
jgi:hypothetical protein